MMPDILDAFDALPQNQPEPMTREQEEAAIDALLGISRDTGPRRLAFAFYDAAGQRYNLSKQQVVTLVNKHKLTKRRIYGNMAVESAEWDNLMAELQIPKNSNYTWIS